MLDVSLTLIYEVAIWFLFWVVILYKNAKIKVEQYGHIISPSSPEARGNFRIIKTSSSYFEWVG